MKRYACMLVLAMGCAASANARSADDILAAGGIRGGLVVHVGCGNGKLTAELRANDKVLVHGLDTDTAQVAEAREHIQSLGLQGSVSVDVFDGEHLPYADNLVNLVVVSGVGCRVSREEVERVLAPRGVVMTNQASHIKHQTWRKPVPDDIDEWTHYLHSANGNPVANDDAVRPPRQLQWVSSPKWGRHHEHMASMNALVSSDGKVFSICDGGPRVSMLHPPQWKLSAHDAFNGLLLWERPIAEWFNHLQPLKSGPASLPRRLVTAENHVYATLGIQAPVSVLDANTGSTLFTCGGTENTQEIVLAGKTLLLVRGVLSTTVITAVSADTGRKLWEKKSPVTTLTLAADGEKVVFFDGRRVIALNRGDGSDLWRSEELGEERKATWTAKDPPRLILGDKAIVVAPKTKVYAISTDDGRILWSAVHPRSGYVSPKDLFVIGDLVWYGDTAGASNTGRFIGRDIMTGEIKRSFTPDIEVIWLSHHRCHFSKATKNFILPARMGVEFVDMEREQWKPHHWVRGGCLYGVMPCNGFTYTPPHACACYFEAKQNGFSAYTSSTGPTPAQGGERLERGAAYAEIADLKSQISEADWPVFRHDSARSGHTASAVATHLSRQWSASIGGKLTQPVVADGRVYVASIDQHTLHAFDAETGKPTWRYVAGGRIDSPPAIHRGLAVFGSRDGWVTCLRCRDGKLAWRFRAAPRELLIMSYGQLESAWPVHGSVLIENDEIHCIAGRNMFLDGGLRYLRLNPDTGKTVSETTMDEKDPIKGGTIQKYDSWLDMTTTLPDVLASDGENIYMRSLPFDKKGRRRRISHFPDESEPARLFSPTGFLDGDWFHRSYWTYARCFPGGWNGHLAAGRYNPSGRLLVTDDSTIYGYGRRPRYYSWTTSLEYRLFATAKRNKPRDIHAWDKYKAAQAKRFPRMKLDRKLSPPFGPKSVPDKPYDCIWEDTKVPLHVTAMVSTSRQLFVAGPRDVFDEGQLYFRNAAAAYEQKAEGAEQQRRMWDGEEGAVLFAVSKKDGTRTAEHKLDALPVFDGLIAAQGRLFVSLKSGDLLCLGSGR